MIVTFAALAAEAVAFHAAHNTPAAVACRAFDTLRDALTGMDPSERSEIIELLAELVDEQPAAVAVEVRIDANQV